jgi:hypothetical protein
MVDPADFGEHSFYTMHRVKTIPRSPFSLQLKESLWHQPDIWGLTNGMLQSLYILLLKPYPSYYNKMSGWCLPGVKASRVQKKYEIPSLSL